MLSIQSIGGMAHLAASLAAKAHESQRSLSGSVGTAIQKGAQWAHGVQSLDDKAVHWLGDRAAEFKGEVDDARRALTEDGHRRGGALGEMEKHLSFAIGMQEGATTAAVEAAHSVYQLVDGASDLLSPAAWVADTDNNLGRLESVGNAAPVLAAAMNPAQLPLMAATDPEGSLALVEGTWTQLAAGYRKGDVAQGIGRGVFDAASLFVGVGELRAAGTAARVTDGLTATRQAAPATKVLDDMGLLQLGAKRPSAPANLFPQRTVPNDIVVSKSDGYFEMRSASDPRFSATAYTEGPELRISLRTRVVGKDGEVLRMDGFSGAKVYDDIFKQLGDVRRVRNEYVDDNLAAFDAALAAGKSPAQAARATWDGQQLGARGFSAESVRIQADGRPVVVWSR